MQIELTDQQAGLLMSKLGQNGFRLYAHYGRELNYDESVQLIKACASTSRGCDKRVDTLAKQIKAS